MSLSVVDVPFGEKQPAFGAFAFQKDAGDLKEAGDRELQTFLGTAEHRDMIAR